MAEIGTVWQPQRPRGLCHRRVGKPCRGLRLGYRQKCRSKSVWALGYVVYRIIPYLGIFLEKRAMVFITFSKNTRRAELDSHLKMNGIVQREWVR